jgi:type III pantothenate kinase
MRLVIDIGNTRVKAALFEQNELKHFFVYTNTEEFLQSQIMEKYKIDNCILVTVIDGIEVFMEEIKRKTSVLIYTTLTATPLKNFYQTIETLGGDRLVGAVAGNFLYPHQPVLVIDAGTCIKYNFVNAYNEFIGGAISPGIKMRFQSLNAFTARLPLLQLDEAYNLLIGRNSKENILTGVELGTVAEITGFIEQYTFLYPDLKVILTGGDAVFFEKRLKKTIFVDPYLILRGLNIILDYNLTHRQ